MKKRLINVEVILRPFGVKVMQKRYKGGEVSSMVQNVSKTVRFKGREVKY